MQNAVSQRVGEDRAEPPRAPEEMSGSRRLIVEFVGLPGVGKSFLSRHLSEHFRRERVDGIETAPHADDLPVHSAIPHVLGKLARALRFAVSHAETTRALVRIVRSDGGGLGFGRLTKLINLLSELARSARVPATVTLVNAQGVLQAVWSLEMRAAEPVHERLLHRCAAWLPDGVVFVEVEWRQNAERLRLRKGGHSRFDDLSAEQLDAEAHKGGRRLHAILDAWAVETPGARRLDFRNEADTDAGVILAWLDEIRDAERVAVPADDDARGDAVIAIPYRSSRPEPEERDDDGRPPGQA